MNDGPSALDSPADLLAMFLFIVFLLYVLSKAWR